MISRSTDCTLPSSSTLKIRMRLTYNMSLLPTVHTMNILIDRTVTRMRHHGAILQVREREEVNFRSMEPRGAVNALRRKIGELTFTSRMTLLEATRENERERGVNTVYRCWLDNSLLDVEWKHIGYMVLKQVLKDNRLLCVQYSHNDDKPNHHSVY